MRIDEIMQIMDRYNEMEIEYLKEIEDTISNIIKSGNLPQKPYGWALATKNFTAQYGEMGSDEHTDIEREVIFALDKEGNFVKHIIEMEEEFFEGRPPLRFPSKETEDCTIGTIIKELDLDAYIEYDNMYGMKEMSSLASDIYLHEEHLIDRYLRIKYEHKGEGLYLKLKEIEKNVVSNTISSHNLSEVSKNDCAPETAEHPPLINTTIKEAEIYTGDLKSYHALTRVYDGVKGNRKWLVKLVTVLIIISSILFVRIMRDVKYNQAIEYMHNEEYDSAYDIFDKLGSYKDSKTMAEMCLRLQEDTYDSGIATVEYDDISNEKGKEPLKKDRESEVYDEGDNYKVVQELIESGKYDEAIDVYKKLDGNGIDNVILQIVDTIKSNINSEVEQNNYERAIEIAEDGIILLNRYDSSKNVHDKMGELQNIINKTKYTLAEEYINSSKYPEAVTILSEISDYEESKERMMQAMYDYASDNSIPSDKLTQEYLILLKKEGYKDSQALYDSLFFYTMEIITNDDAEDVSTDMTEINYESDKYFHFRLGFTGDISLEENRTHKVNYELWQYARSGFGSVYDVEVGKWYYIKFSYSGGGAANMKLCLTLDNDKETIYGKELVLYWVDMNTGTKRYE